MALMMRDDVLAQGDELGVGHVVFGVVDAPCAEPHAPCAVGSEHVIDVRDSHVEGW